MKKSLKKLKFSKEIISNLNSDTIKGGGFGTHGWTVSCHHGGTNVTCESVTVWEGGNGCHIK